MARLKNLIFIPIYSEETSAAVATQVQSIDDISKASENLAEIAVSLQEEVARFIV